MNYSIKFAALLAFTVLFNMPTQAMFRIACRSAAASTVSRITPLQSKHIENRSFFSRSKSNEPKIQEKCAYTQRMEEVLLKKIKSIEKPHHQVAYIHNLERVLALQAFGGRVNTTVATRGDYWINGERIFDIEDGSQEPKIEIQKLKKTYIALMNATIRYLEE